MIEAYALEIVLAAFGLTVASVFWIVSLCFTPRGRDRLQALKEFEEYRARKKPTYDAQHPD